MSLIVGMFWEEWCPVIQPTNKAIVGFMLVMASAGHCHAQTNFYDQVTRMWLNGQKQEVYCIATNRLAADSNDITGLVLKMEYELASCDYNLTNTLTRAVAVGSGITTTNFAQLYPLLQFEASDLQVFLASYSTNCLAEDRAKANITNKPMTYRRLIQAIETDGLIGN